MIYNLIILWDIIEPSMLVKSFLKTLVAVVICWQIATLPSCALIQSKFYSYRPPSFDSTGKVYMGREIAKVMGHQGADWLERPERVVEEQPEKTIASLELKSTDVVADIGAGTGYFSELLARQVPQGQVISTDIQPEMIALLKQRIDRQKISNIQTQLGTEQSAELSPASVDLAIMVDVYHELSYPQEMMTGIVAALKPGGRVVLVEYRGEDPKINIKPHHKTTEKQMQKELMAVGLKWQKTDGILPQQHILFFAKPS
jgi:ubiquinone/menaquinone biosynthesis C-methylase UbiE